VPRVTRRRKIEAPASRVWELVSDPYSLPRWWPRAIRVENVEEAGGGEPSEWTMVLGTSEGRGVRADFRCLSSAEGEHHAWEQRIAGTPFQRHLRRAAVVIGLRADGGATDVSISSLQSLRGLSRLGSLLMRRGQREILEGALDGIERALT
jgi:uncharacterized protein YndB with AHSA1/START domain